MLDFSCKRDLPEGKYKLADIFDGLENAPELKAIFGDKVGELKDVGVVITDKIKLDKPPYLEGKLEYAYIKDGEVHIGTDYITTGREDYLYLDMIHELVHIKQHWDGLELFDEKYAYVDRPTEIEAYKTAVAAAKRLGMNRQEISEYLEVPWCSKEEMTRLEKVIKL